MNTAPARASLNPRAPDATERQRPSTRHTRSRSRYVHVRLGAQRFTFTNTMYVVNSVVLCLVELPLKVLMKLEIRAAQRHVDALIDKNYTFA